MVNLTEFERALDETAGRVTLSLDELLPQPAGPESRLMEAMRYAALAGGKRFRPFLALECGKLFDVPGEQMLRIAAAIECVHTYSLIHDDLPAMDDDNMRRGQPTTHLQYDEATAILAGDALLTFGFEILGSDKTHEDAMVRSQLMSKLAQAAGPAGMVGGQMIDIEAEKQIFDVGTITRLQRMKTGALIAYSCEAGGIAGHARSEALHAVTAYAHDLGLAFQITDDLLDEQGDAEEMGKASRKDEAAGKATFVSLLGVERANDQAELLAQQAVDHLAVFDKRADLLRTAPEFVLKRVK